MNPTPHTILECVAADGRSPYRDWLNSIPDRVTRRRIAMRVTRLASGNPGVSRPVGNGVSELKIDFGPGYRVYFARMTPASYMILAGGTKASQQADIQIAQRRWDEYRKLRP